MVYELIKPHERGCFTRKRVRIAFHCIMKKILVNRIKTKLNSWAVFNESFSTKLAVRDQCNNTEFCAYLSIHVLLPCRCRRGVLSIGVKRRWRRITRIRGRVQVLYHRRWWNVIRKRRMIAVRIGRKLMKISIRRGRVQMLIPSHYETVKPKPKPRPRPRRRRPTRRRRGRYGRARGRRRRQRWRRRLQRRRRRRRRRYIRRRRQPIILFNYRGRWRPLVKWRGEYRMRYHRRWITFRWVKWYYRK